MPRGPMTQALFNRLLRQSTRALLGELGDALASAGGIVIASGGTISGTYTGTVLCQGDVTMAGAVEVQGDLIVMGDLINADGHALDVKGGLYAQDLLFTKTDTSTPQSSIDVDGDLICDDFVFPQCGGTAAELRVNGNMTARGTLDFSGISADIGTPGLTVDVEGSLVADGINIEGGDGADGNGGNGGDLDVYGSLTLSGELLGNGGDANNGDGGAGATLTVRGNTNAGYTSIYMNGGSAVNGNGGRGGGVSCDGDVSVNELNLYGGGCTSDNANHSSGRGGEVTIDANFTANSSVDLSGGYRDGTLSEGPTGEVGVPDGGEFNVFGSVVIDGDFYSRGGSVGTLGFSPHDAGRGGYVRVEGNVNIASEFSVSGGNHDRGNAGDSGELIVGGNIVVDDEMNLQGGNAQLGNGGNGGIFAVDGTATVDGLDTSGGSADGGNGGNGGNIDLGGALLTSGVIRANGGSCISTDETHYAGSAGNISSRGISAEGELIYLTGGTRSGATTAPNTSNSAASGGSVTCNGDLLVGSIFTEGGAVLTDYPNSVGGNGGPVSVQGSMVLTGILQTTGGSSNGNNAGTGGSVEVVGHSSLNEMSISGGAANESVVGADAGENGASGNASFEGGVSINLLTMLDGSGEGAVPSINRVLSLGGSCHIGTLDMASRAECWINSAPQRPVTLRLSAMLAKTTLNTAAGAETESISGDLLTSLFMAGTGSNWHIVTGTPI